MVEHELVEHGVGLAGAGHAVDEDGGVEAGEQVVDGFEHGAVEELEVGASAREDALVVEHPVQVRGVVGSDYLDLLVVEEAH